MKDFKIRNKALKTVIRETAEVAGFLWQRGWAERNAGNISIDISAFMQQEFSESDTHPFIPLGFTYPKLEGRYYLVTGTGKRMRDLLRKPMKNALIIRLNEDASSYSIISQRADKELFMPTSELTTHLGIHQMIAERGREGKVVIHTHATELVALTQNKELCNRDALNKILWNMHPETIMFAPEGIGFVPYFLPGSPEIAKETIKVLHHHDVAIWEKHGVFAIGESVHDTFDKIDILVKAARIYFLCCSAGIIPEGFTKKQLEELIKLSGNF